MPDKTKELHARLVAWRTEVKAPMPTRNDGSAPAPKERVKGKKNRNKNEKE
jgi:hypothetical protein